MQVELFKALKSVNVSDDQATAVVAQLEDFIVRKVEDANRDLTAKIDGMVAAERATIAQQNQIIALQSRQTTIFGGILALGSLIIAGATIAVKFIH